jgi:glutamate-ammonia-ligase adenylyltransferase
MSPPDPQAVIAQAGEYSRWLAGRLAAQPDLAADLAAGLARPWSRTEMDDWLAAQAADDEAALGRALRRLRQRLLARLIARDLAGMADLAEVTRSMTEFAELAVQAGLDFLHRDLAGVHGEPLDGRGSPQRLIVVGMGKLGGGELNVSSDIDLIFVYPEDGETSGPRRLGNHEFFVRLGKRLINLLNEATADGFVFRVDMRLRPYGDSGPLVSSFAMLEQYFYTQAREWERYAWIKGRAISGERVAELEQLRRPFVFRKYLDFGAFGAMRELHAQIRREVMRRDKADNIKLGPGGIREIEFIAQVFQLIRGGKLSSLQARPTRAVLHQLAAYNLIPEETAAVLEEAYVFLRNLEHRLQYLDDAQTQTLPHDLEARRRVAAAMGYADWEGFEAHLNSLRRKVSGQFEQVFGAPQEDQSGHPLAGLCDQSAEAAVPRLDELGYRDAAATLERLRALRSSSRYHALPAANKTALEGLLPPLIEVSARFPNPDETLARILDLLEAVSRRAPYLQLMQEYPQTLNQVARLASASPWAAQYLRQRPHLLDELLDPRALYAAPDWQLARRELAERLAGLAGDVEQQMDTLRHFKQAATFRLLAQDLADKLSIETLSDHLADLADLMVEATLGLVWASLSGRHREVPAFAVIAYGKLGGKELGYASDLDIVFLYDDDHPDAQEVYAKLAKRLNTWLSTLTPAGVLYETDLRLRPDGAAGLLVSTIAAFEDYQRRSAWTWEHQALTRARYCCGDRGVGARFEAIREAVLRQPRDPAKLRDEVLEMRRKMRDGHPNPSGRFDVKHDPGGLVDVEFAVQYLVLAHAHAHAALTANVGNIALLGRCAELGLLPAEVARPAADAYRELRRLQHAVKLRGDEYARVDLAEVAEKARAVLRLWLAVFGEGATA